MDTTLETDIRHLIIPDCKETVAKIIAQNNGSEVFFIGKLDEELCIIEIEAYAFGNETSVPATIRQAVWGDIVLHNHPSGVLQPSQADINIASELADMGIGSYIVNNDCSQIKIIVKPFAIKETTAIASDEVEELISKNGPLAKALPDFEERPQQIEMAKAVNEAFNNDEISIIEAGTGVGKSLAYLVPAILWAIKNKERVVISTNTINLQEQLIQKDIPAIKEYTDLEFNAVLVKGRGNYVSIRRAKHAVEESDLFDQAEDKSALKDILKWLEVTQDGSLSDLSPEPTDHLWEKVQSQTDNCMRVRCKNYSDCFFFKSRRAAARAQILVTNHHVLMADLTLRREMGDYNRTAILPPYKRVIIDEAHNIEEVATSYLGSRTSRRGLTQLLYRLYNIKKVNSGSLPALAQKITGFEQIHKDEALTEIQNLVWEELIPGVSQLNDMIEEKFHFMLDSILDYFETHNIEIHSKGIEYRLTNQFMETPIWKQNLTQSLEELASHFSMMANRLVKVIRNFEKLNDELIDRLYNNQMDLQSLATRLKNTSQRFKQFVGDETLLCRWIELRRAESDQNYSLGFCFAPLEIGGELRQALFNPLKTCVMTSATLTVGKKFDFYLQRTGLQYDPQEFTLEPSNDLKFRTLQLNTPFNYEQQVMVAVPTDIPEPTQSDFEQNLKQLILKSITISEGRAFILFTSYKLLDSMHRELKDFIETLGYQCLKQGQESRHRLLNRFKRDQHSVLFATSSFWEGVDVKGDSLSLLILTRLPFRVPTEPVMEARVEYLEQQGKNAFMEFTVPHAVIRFKQGFGRLIRHKEDRGAVLIFDRRVITKFYGKIFTKSLPTKTVLQLQREDLFRQLNKFFQNNE